MIEGAVPKRQPTMDEVMGGAGPGTNEVDFEREYQMMEMIVVREPAASPELDVQVGETMNKVQGAVYHICSIRKVHYPMFV